MPKRKQRDTTKSYTLHQYIAKLRRLANGLARKKQFTIQIAGERIRVPKDAIVNIEHERGETEEEIEFQIVWKRKN